jgi:hypothetical protein
VAEIILGGFNWKKNWGAGYVEGLLERLHLVLNFKLHFL